MRKLNDDEKYVILAAGTEKPFSGKYYLNHRFGKYSCKQCGLSLFNSQDQFDASCGWPSFDDAIGDNVKKRMDEDGVRDEVRCKKCEGHLGHIFVGEGFTIKNKRYCINSISLDFKEDKIGKNEEVAYFAGGCFWGIESFFSKAKGVKSANSGFMGGKTENPTYEEVKKQGTGHIETVKVVFNKDKTNYEELCRLFFEIHDPTQEDGQGPDKGPQYISAIFYDNLKQKKICETLISQLKDKSLKVVTKLTNAKGITFWGAELYHQRYYSKNGRQPYCHGWIEKF